MAVFLGPHPPLPWVLILKVVHHVTDAKGRADAHLLLSLRCVVGVHEDEVEGVQEAATGDVVRKFNL
jgi:hypothetical protein